MKLLSMTWILGCVTLHLNHKSDKQFAFIYRDAFIYNGLLNKGPAVREV